LSQYSPYQYPYLDYNTLSQYHIITNQIITLSQIDTNYLIKVQRRPILVTYVLFKYSNIQKFKNQTSSHPGDVHLVHVLPLPPTKTALSLIGIIGIISVISIMSVISIISLVSIISMIGIISIVQVLSPPPRRTLHSLKRYSLRNLHLLLCPFFPSSYISTSRWCSSCPSLR